MKEQSLCQKNTAYVLIGIVVLVVLVAVSLKIFLPQKPSPDTNLNSSIRIGLSLGTLREERWQRDRDLFMAAAQKQGAYVQVMNANSDADLQTSQVENFISQGVNIIVVVPHDGEKAAAIVEAAHKAGIKIIAYDRMINNSDVDYYISFDSVKVGTMQAAGVVAVKAKGNFAYIGGSPTDNNAKLLQEGSMEVLNPLIRKGDIRLVINQFMTDWKPDEAYKAIKQYLAGGGTLDAVIAANDGTAFGAIRALTEYGLAGKVPVSGQDAELSAVQRVVAGTQTMTAYKPISALAAKAADIAVTMAMNETPESNRKVNNGKIEVPSFLLDPILVTKETVNQTVISDGYHTKEQVYSTN